MHLIVNMNHVQVNPYYRASSIMDDYVGHEHGGGSLTLPDPDLFMFPPSGYQGGGSGLTSIDTHPTQHDYMGYHGGLSGLT